MKVQQPKTIKSAGSAAKVGKGASASAAASAKTGSSKKKGEVSSCQKCGSVISEEIRALQCDRCEASEAWCCIDCLNISVEAYEALIGGTGGNCCLRWFCDNCEKSVMSEHDEEKLALNKRLDEMCAMLQQILDRQSDMDSRILSLEVALQDKADNKVIQQLADRLSAVESKCPVNNSTDMDTTNVKQIVSQGVVTASTSLVDQNVAELTDRERRKNNLIFFNLDESDKSDPQTRMQEDLDVVTKMVRDQMHVMAELTNPIRFGPRPIGEAKPRPLRITVDNEEIKWKILKASKNLSSVQQESALPVFVRRDMTSLEREMESSLRQQLKVKREQAEKDGDPRRWIIRRGKIVSLVF
jgi:hypothetical protein